jgi:uncharacterized protein Smg (DUF494 family)
MYSLAQSHTTKTAHVKQVIYLKCLVTNMGRACHGFVQFNSQSNQGIPEESKVAITVVISCETDEKCLNFKVLLIEFHCATQWHI